MSQVGHPYIEEMRLLDGGNKNFRVVPEPGRNGRRVALWRVNDEKIGFTQGHLAWFASPPIFSNRTG